MTNPENIIYSYPEREVGLCPAFENLPLPADLSTWDVTLLDITIPTDNPPISFPGTYTFALLATTPNTANPISNLTTLTFQVK